jgi:hypothetical protein
VIIGSVLATRPAGAGIPRRLRRSLAESAAEQPEITT